MVFPHISALVFILILSYGEFVLCVCFASVVLSRTDCGVKNMKYLKFCFKCYFMLFVLFCSCQGTINCFNELNTIIVVVYKLK